MASFLGYLPETIVLLLFLCLVWLWQKLKEPASVRLQLCITDIPRVKAWDKSHVDMNRRENELTEANGWISRSSILPNNASVDGAFPGGNIGSSVTSGQLAYMVQRRDQQKDTERNSTYGAPYPGISRRNCSLNPPWSRHADNDGSIIETDVIETSQDSDLHGIWRRRVLQFVGQ
jgi:hypothetical protein